MHTTFYNTDQIKSTLLLVSNEETVVLRLQRNMHTTPLSQPTKSIIH